MAKPIIVKWIDDPLTEIDLGMAGLTFTKQDGIRYCDIDIHAGLHNRAREFSSLNEELWMDYALKMESGHPFKRVVLYTVNDGVFKFGVAHGNHRLKALAMCHNDNLRSLKTAEVGAYVVPSVYNDDLEEYERLANNKEGGRQSSGYAMNNAIWLVQNRKTTIKRASQRTGLSESQISDEIRARETRVKVEGLGIPTNTLTSTHLKRLGSLKYQSHLKHLAEFANDHRVPSDDLSRMVTVVNTCRSEAKGNAYLHDEMIRLRRQCVGPKVGPVPSDQRSKKVFLRALTRFEDLWLRGNKGRPIGSLLDVGVASQDKQLRMEIQSRIEDLITVMRKVVRLK